MFLKPSSVLMALVQTLLRQLRRPLQIKKIITNTPFALHSLQWNSGKSCSLGQMRHSWRNSRRHFKMCTEKGAIIGTWWVVSTVEWDKNLQELQWQKIRWMVVRYKTVQLFNKKCFTISWWWCRNFELSQIGATLQNDIIGNFQFQRPNW